MCWDQSCGRPLPSTQSGSRPRRKACVSCKPHCLYKPLRAREPLSTHNGGKSEVPRCQLGQPHGHAFLPEGGVACRQFPCSPCHQFVLVPLRMLGKKGVKTVKSLCLYIYLQILCRIGRLVFLSCSWAFTWRFLTVG